MGTIITQGRTDSGTAKKFRMRRIGVFAAAPALILAGIGTWAASTTHVRDDIPIEARIDPSQMMENARDLPTEHHPDYSLVFD